MYLYKDDELKDFLNSFSFIKHR